MEDKLTKEELEKKLQPKQVLFCKYYVSDETFANGVQSYAKAYNKDTTVSKEYNTCRTNAYDLLTSTYILDYLGYLLDDAGLNDAFVDKELLFTLKQHADLSAKMAAIREYNKLRNRITAHSDVTSNGEALNIVVGDIKLDRDGSDN